MKNGDYELVRAPPGYPGKRYRGLYCYEHHLVWWQNTGALPPEGHVVHHKNENKRDNRFENLESKEWSLHSAEHMQKPLISAVCGWCREEFSISGAELRKRQKRSETGDIYCSRSCGMKAARQRRGSRK